MIKSQLDAVRFSVAGPARGHNKFRFIQAGTGIVDPCTDTLALFQITDFIQSVEKYQRRPVMQPVIEIFRLYVQDMLFRPPG